MFIGSIPREARYVTQDMLKNLTADTPVYVGCSGNFTADRIAAALGYPVHSNDVSLYSRLIADILLNRETPLTCIDPQFNELFRAWPAHRFKPLIQVLFVLRIAPFLLETNAYQQRIANAFKDGHLAFYQSSVRKFEEKEVFHFKIADFFFGDFRKHVMVPEGVSLVYAPTYKGGYEKMYAAIEANFEYPKAEYSIFDPKNAGSFYRTLFETKPAMIYADSTYEEIEPFLKTKISIPGKRSVLLYTNIAAKKTLITVRKQPNAYNYTLLTSDFEFCPQTEITTALCKTDVINYYKSLFMGAKVNYTEGGDFGLLFYADGLLFGFACFSAQLSDLDSLFVQADFVCGAAIKRLSKLVLYLLRSSSVKNMLTQKYRFAYTSLRTTVFTDKPVSMKYRGVFKLEKRVKKKSKLIYGATFAPYDLKECYLKWLNQKSLNTSTRDSRK